MIIIWLMAFESASACETNESIQSSLTAIQSEMNSLKQTTQTQLDSQIAKIDSNYDQKISDALIYFYKTGPQLPQGCDASTYNPNLKYDNSAFKNDSCLNQARILYQGKKEIIDGFNGYSNDPIYSENNFKKTNRRIEKQQAKDDSDAQYNVNYNILLDRYNQVSITTRCNPEITPVILPQISPAKSAPNKPLEINLPEKKIVTIKPIIKSIAITTGQPVISTIQQNPKPQVEIKHNWFINLLLKIRYWFN